jgi:hypothetical protein
MQRLSSPQVIILALTGKGRVKIDQKNVKSSLNPLSNRKLGSPFSDNLRALKSPLAEPLMRQALTAAKAMLEFRSGPCAYPIGALTGANHT